MVNEYNSCPECGAKIERYKNPIPTVDIIIEMIEDNEFKGIVLIFRKNIPKKWAIPGGYVDYGESIETAAAREAKEETSLEINNLKLFNAYSEPNRDPRKHTISNVFIAQADGNPSAGDDAEKVGIFNENNFPSDMAFDHKKILKDYFLSKKTGK